jgi:hypothetical protein
MNQKGNSAKEPGSLGPTVSEEKFRAELRETVRGLLRSWGGDLRKVHPIHPQQEHYLGFDDLYEWESLRLNLPSPSLPQSGIILRSPLIVQYKVSQSDRGNFLYSLPIDQYLIMSAYQHIGKCALYALSRVRTLQELEAAREDLFRMAYWVEPRELNITRFAHEEYLLNVDPETGSWSTRPVESKLLSVPYDPDPEKLRARLEKALAELVPPELIREESSSLELIQNAFEVARLMSGNDNFPGNAKLWGKYEIKEG